MESRTPAPYPVEKPPVRHRGTCAVRLNHPGRVGVHPPAPPPASPARSQRTSDVGPADTGLPNMPWSHDAGSIIRMRGTRTQVVLGTRSRTYLMRPPAPRWGSWSAVQPSHLLVRWVRTMSGRRNPNMRIARTGIQSVNFIGARTYSDPSLTASNNPINTNCGRSLAALKRVSICAKPSETKPATSTIAINPAWIQSSGANANAITNNAASEITALRGDRRRETSWDISGDMSVARENGFRRGGHLSTSAC